MCNDLCYEYLNLINRFKTKDLTIEEFQALYFDKFKLETREMNEELYLLLDKLFSDLDVYTDDEVLQASYPENYINKTELLSMIDLAYSGLKRLIKNSKP